MAPVIAFGGVADLAAGLRRQFLRDGADPAALRFGEPEGAAVYLHVLGADAETLRRAHRSGVPVIAVSAPELEAIVRAVAKRLGEAGPPLAARVPILREAVCDRLVSVHARRAALARDAGALALSPLVHGIAQAYGEQVGPPELAAALGAGFACEALAGRLRDRAPVAGWAVRGAVSYAGTRAIGAAVKKRFALATSAIPPARATRPRGAAVPVAP